MFYIPTRFRPGYRIEKNYNSFNISDKTEFEVSQCNLKYFNSFDKYCFFVQTNKHGEGAVHIAAGLGKLEILKVSSFHKILYLTRQNIVHINLPKNGTL